VSRILLDTHLLLWAVAEPSKLPAGARSRIARAEVFVSAASIWEVSIKAALGKLAADPAELLAEIEPAGFSLLPVTGEHAAAVAKLPAVYAAGGRTRHTDPFDRMLVAQAKTEPLVLLTNDAILAGYGDCVELAAPKPRRPRP
jgi:PIN domain nuclease of toxin-antitoxin system